jgi:uncharacterized protein (TIGR01741 family)
METKGKAQFYQEIGTTLNEIIPEEWQKVFVYAEVEEDFSKVGFYYYPKSNSNPVHVMEITKLFEVNEDYIDEQRNKLSELFELLWKEYSQNSSEVWTSMTFILECSGEFKIELEYDDLSEVDDFERQIIWRYKYLALEPPVEKKRARQIFERYLEKNGGR